MLAEGLHGTQNLLMTEIQKRDEEIAQLRQQLATQRQLHQTESDSLRLANSALTASVQAMQETLQTKSQAHQDLTLRLQVASEMSDAILQSLAVMVRATDLETPVEEIRGISSSQLFNLSNTGPTPDQSSFSIGDDEEGGI